MTKEKEVPWWKIHQIVDELNATLEHITSVDSRGNVSKRIVITYTEDE